MTDTVDVSVIHNSPRYYIVHLTNESDGTGESAVTKIDKSSLTGPDGSECGTLCLLEASWSVSSGYVVIEWAHNTNDEMLVCNGSGYANFTSFGCKNDPGSTGGTGDVVLTTDGFSDGDSYDITLVFKKKD